MCSGCTNDVDPRLHLLCCLCEGAYCLDCANVSEQRYYSTMNMEHRSKWKCPACCCNQPKRDNSNTPVGIHANLGNDAENVTIRRNPLLNLQGVPKCNMNDTILDDSVNTFTLREIIREELGAALCDSLADKLSQVIVGKIETVISSTLANLTTTISTIVENKLKVLDKARVVASKTTTNPDTSKTTTQKPVVRVTKNITTKKAAHKVPSLMHKAEDESTQQLPHTVSERASGANGNPAVETLPPFVVAKDAKDNPWIEVKRKRTRVTCGSATPGMSQLEASQRIRHLHLYFVKAGTAVEQIRLHLNTVCNSNEVLSIESLKARGNYASFKLTVTCGSAEKVMAPETWPQGVCIKPWTLPFRKNYESERKKVQSV